MSHVLQIAAIVALCKNHGLVKDVIPGQSDTSSRACEAQVRKRLKNHLYG